MTVSIILPLYNSEKTIEKMINSIVNQSFDDWELIVIDDGSTDNSGIIADKYSCLDSRIRVLHKQNEGVALARKLGVESANGDYIIHADSDDWCHKDFLKFLVTKALADDADIVISDFYCVYLDKSIRIRCQKPTRPTSEGVLMDIFNGHIFGALWNKLIRRSIVCDSKATFFIDVNYSEDVLFLSQLLLYTELKISYVESPLYYYVVNENSLTNRFNEKSFRYLSNYYAKLRDILPYKEPYCDFLDSLPMGRFSAGFIYGIFKGREIKREFKAVRHIAYKTKSFRWRIGYFLIDMGFYELARKCLKM